MLVRTVDVPTAPATGGSKIVRRASLSKQAPPQPRMVLKDLSTGREIPVDMVKPGYLDGKSIAKAGLKVYDPGYRATAVIRSAMTQIDGEAGLLRYRGYPIDDLVRLSFLEVFYLLNYGELPDRPQIQSFTQRVYEPKPEMDAFAKNIVRSLGPGASSMLAVATVLAGMGSTMSEDDPNRLYDPLVYKRDRDATYNMLEKSVASIPNIWLNVFDALLPGHHNGTTLDPTFDLNLGFAENFAKKLRLDERSGLPFDECAKALNTIWILQMDHEMTASTAAVLHLSSTLVSPWAAFSAGILTGYGPLHGGAIEIALFQLVEIGSPENVPAYLERVKKQEVRLFGFGHRIYRVEDPRSRIIRQTLMHLQDLRRQLHGETDPLVEVALALEAAALKDEYFIRRKLAPNADFFGALVYHCIGIPGEFGLSAAAIARSAGAISHWVEAMTNPNIAIWRPSQMLEKGPERTSEPQSVVYQRPVISPKAYTVSSRL